ncbi:hypothetical protein [Saccharothrix xinjiangensis]|uniref:Uncharacterized protein n=1 Tax=Saccharothrix xinjiangensis TaxID=204798 RepID=A0ABV9XXY8_9PSEU
MRLIVQPQVVGGDAWNAYGGRWHPAELASVPARIGAEFAWQDEGRVFMTFYGGNGHRPVTDALPGWARQWLSVHLRFVEQWTGQRDIIDLIPASQAYRLPMFAALAV